VPTSKSNAANFDGATARAAINAAMALLQKRWALRIIWELRGDSLTFRAVQAACNEVSPTVLNQRLAELREAGIVSHLPGSGYQLTAQGSSLLKAMWPLLEWSVGWYRDETRRRLKR
jgi:DNA-binding HxlR family transcriptional regulator